MEIKLNSSNFNETIKSEEKILVDFWATTSAKWTLTRHRISLEPTAL